MQLAFCQIINLMFYYLKQFQHVAYMQLAKVTHRLTKTNKSRSQF